MQQLHMVCLLTQSIVLYRVQNLWFLQILYALHRTTVKGKPVRSKHIRAFLTQFIRALFSFKEFFRFAVAFFSHVYTQVKGSDRRYPGRRSAPHAGTPAPRRAALARKEAIPWHWTLKSFLALRPICSAFPRGRRADPGDQRLRAPRRGRAVSG